METSLLIVTPQQYQAGYFELRGVTPIHRSFKVVGRDNYGNYIVLDPWPERKGGSDVR